MTLGLGSVGEAVRQLQNSLNSLAQAADVRFMSTAPLLTIDGIYGQRTFARVREFQSRNQLVPDGIVGSLTLGAIQFALRLLGQIVPPKPQGPYKRMLAVIYAATFYNRVCSDGRIAMKTGYPKQINGNTLTPGMLFSEVGPRGGLEEDCTHFISCCIGSPPVVKINNIPIQGGGLPISQPFKQVGVYGQTYVPTLLGELVAKKFATIVGRQFRVKGDDSTKAAIAKELQPGDLLAYASKDNPNNYEHFAILVGPTNISCHTSSRFGEDFTDVYFPWVTLLKLP